MRNLILFSMAIASAFAIEGCTSPNEENETVTYNILERINYTAGYTPIVAECIYDTIQLYPDILMTPCLSEYNDYYNHTTVDIKVTNVFDKQNDCPYIDWVVNMSVILDTTWFWRAYIDRLNSTETLTITDKNQIIRTIKATNEATIFNIRKRITDTSRISARLNACSKIGFVGPPSQSGETQFQKGQPLYYDTDKPSVLYEIEGRYDDEFMFVCNDEVHRSNKVYLYYFYKIEENENLARYTLVPALIDNE